MHTLHLNLYKVVNIGQMHMEITEQSHISIVPNTSSFCHLSAERLEQQGVAMPLRFVATLC